MPKNCPIGKLESHACWGCFYDFGNACIYNEMQEEKEEAKKILAEQNQIKYGEWEPVEEEAFWIHNMEESLETGKPTKAIMLRCSCCKKIFGTIAFDFKYCPECGAKMDGGEKNEK